MTRRQGVENDQHDHDLRGSSRRTIFANTGPVNHSHHRCLLTRDGPCGVEINRSTVTDLLVEYWHEVDHHDGLSAHLLFAVDGEMTFDRATFRGQDAIARVYTNRAARGPRVSRHVITNISLGPVRDDAIRVESILLLFAQDGLPPRPSIVPTSVADVVDDLTLSDGRLVIARRVLTNMFLTDENDLAVPTK